MHLAEQPRKKKGKGRKAGQISIPPMKWMLASIMVNEKGLYKDISALFEAAFDDLAAKHGLALKVEVEEVDRHQKNR
jgi:hypothetical protein